MASNNAARASTLPPPPSATSRRISSAALTACVAQDCADARAAAELTELERLRAETTAAVLAAGDPDTRSTMPARGRGRRS